MSVSSVLPGRPSDPSKICTQARVKERHKEGLRCSVYLIIVSGHTYNIKYGFGVFDV